MQLHFAVCVDALHIPKFVVFVVAVGNYFTKDLL